MKDKSSMLTPHYAIFLRVSGKRCVVVGGGLVALRKVKTLIEHGAQVDIISPKVVPGLRRLVDSGRVSLLSRPYRAGDLKGAFVVIAATGDAAVNNKVANEANSECVLVNVVDDAANSDFILPSYVRRGDVTVAVGTEGRSPALARKIRARIENELGEEYAELAILIDEVRVQLKRQKISVRPDRWQDVLDLDKLCEMVRKGQSDEARQLMLSDLARIK